jgi:phenylacetic acid degradation protein
MNAVILHGAEVGDECIVASLSLLREGTSFPPRKLIAGNPARAVKDLGPGMIKRIKNGANLYAQLSERYHKGLELLDGM